MLDCTLLEQGKRYLYKGKFLTYQYQIPGTKPLYVFCTVRGTRKELSQEVVRREVWQEITPNLEVFHE